MSTYRFHLNATRQPAEGSTSMSMMIGIPDPGKSVSVLAEGPEAAIEKALSLLGPTLDGFYWSFETLSIIEQDPEPVMTVEDAERPINYNVHMEFGEDSRQTMRGMAWPPTTMASGASAAAADLTSRDAPVLFGGPGR